MKVIHRTKDSDAIRRIIDDHAAKITDARDTRLNILAAAFLDQTGLHPNECQLVEERSDDGRKTTWRFERIPTT